MGCQSSKQSVQNAYEEGDCLTLADLEDTIEMTEALRDIEIRLALPRYLNLSVIVDSLEDYNMGYAGMLKEFVGLYPSNLLCMILPTILGLENCPAEQRDKRQRLFLEACQQRNCYHAALCAAVLTRSLHKIEHLIPFIDLEKAQDTLCYCTSFYPSDKPARSWSISVRVSPDSLLAWSLVLEALKKHPEWGSFTLAHLARENFELQPEKTFMHCLILMIKIHPSVEGMITNMIGSEKDLDQFLDIVEENNTFERKQLMWLDFIISFLSDTRNDQNKSIKSFRRKEAKLIERGLSITSPPPEENLENFEGFLSAADFGWTDLIQVYYRSGFVSPAQLFKLLMKKRLEWGDMDEEKSAEQIKTDRFIWTLAENPRRLQDMCAFAVSASLGHRSLADRAAKAQTLELPIHLKEKVLFKDVVEDFIQDTDFSDAST